MNQYKLYYWPLPFRGNFPRILLEHAGIPYRLSTLDENVTLKDAPVTQQGIPAMAPPVLHDFENDAWINQMPAIMVYLADRHGYQPNDIYQRAQAIKVVCDCNDVLSDLTRANGSMMWNHADWQLFRRQRLVRWFSIFEELGLRNGVSENDGFLLGTDGPSLADLAATALFSTLVRCLPELSPDVTAHAPRVADLVQRISETSAVAAFFDTQLTSTGKLYCGGQIEASIREMLKLDAA